VKPTSQDRQIIELLNQNARMHSSKISQATGIPERTVRYRINKLLAEGIIRPVAVVEPEHFGYTMIVDIYCQVDMALRETVLKSLIGLSEITYLAYSTGDHDLNIQARFKSSAEMHEFISDRLAHIPGLLRTRTELVASILKETNRWLPPEEAYVPG
jgi:Lrp/AsnC family transcriptional regulator for asnA, asnC and gidA